MNCTERDVAFALVKDQKSRSSFGNGFDCISNLDGCFCILKTTTIVAPVFVHVHLPDQVFVTAVEQSALSLDIVE